MGLAAAGAGTNGYAAITSNGFWRYPTPTPMARVASGVLAVLMATVASVPVLAWVAS